MPGFKIAKERVTIMLGGNLSGNCKLKPLPVYHSLKPRPFKNIDTQTLPVIWKANKKAWVTRVIFLEWFKENFIPEVKAYLEKLKIPFKVLLLLDNAPGHPVDLNEIHPNVEVVFFPPRTTALLQPMDQGVIATFKSYYLRRTSKAIESIETNHETLIEFWKKYNVYDAINNISAAWNEVTQVTLSRCWKNVFQEENYDFLEENSADDVLQIRQQCASLLLHLNIEANIDDINELIIYQNEPLSNNELLEMQSIEEQNNSSDDEVV